MGLHTLLFSIIVCLSIGYAQDSWIQVDSLNGPPKSVTTSFVLNDNGYVVGGLTAIDFTRKMYSYNPNQDDWDDELSWGGEEGSGQNRGSACSFVANNKAYVGLGQGNTAGFYKDFWEYDAETHVWTQVADFTGSARRNAVAFAIDNKGYVGTGQDEFGLTKDFYQYEPTTNTWMQIADFGGTPRKSAVGFELGGNGYVGTGDDGVYRNDFWAYLPTFDVWAQRASIPSTGKAGATGWSTFPTAYICTGENPDGQFSNEVWEYNVYGNAWFQRANFPGSARKFATAFVINDVAYVGSGYNDAGFYDDFYAYTRMLGVDENQTISITVYPNPSALNITIELPPNSDQLEIFNALGQLIFTDKNWDEHLKQTSIYVENWASGNYFIHLKSKQLILGVAQFVKQ